MDKILITDLVATGIVGVEHPERDYPQELLINVEVFYSFDQIGQTDAINDGISYSFIAKLIRRHVRETNYHTLEALGVSLIAAIFENSPAKAVRIRIEKENFVTKTKRVGVELYRQKPL